MKIGFIGAHGTGKTYLARRLSSYLELPLISETAREVSLQFNLPLFPNNTVELQRLIFLRQLKKELTYKRGVFDRTLIDNLAYLQRFVYAPHENISTREFNEMLAIACMMIDNYDFLFLCTVSRKIGIIGDGIRDTDVEKAIEIEHIINNLLMECEDVSYIVLYEDDIEKRWEKIIEVIS